MISANAVFIALMANQYGIYTENEHYYSEIYRWSASQLDYMLGDNKMNRSYQIGYGGNSVRNPHHKSR